MHIKLYVALILAIGTLVCSSCKDSEEAFYSDNEQDRDNDEITGDDYVYHLPVIFHVLYKDKDAMDDTQARNQYVAYNRLKTILENVNDLYAGQLYNFGKETDSHSENIHVQFELALYDENGKKLATPGVEYIKYTGEYPIDCNTFMTQKKGKNKIIWDPNEYINVMVYNFKQTNENSVTLGISNLPYQLNGYPQLEGLEDAKDNTNINKNNLAFEYCVSINSLYINHESTRYTDGKHGQEGYNYDSSDINVTLAHELGHYLGLHHVFAEKKTDDGSEPADNCDDTDYCTDTKSYNKTNYDKWLTQYVKQQKDNNQAQDMQELIKRSNNQGDEWDSDNFMDYAVSLSYRFTPEQRNRIRQVLYYSPLIPGPKKNRNASSTTRSNDDSKIIDLPIRLAEEKAIPQTLISKKAQVIPVSKSKHKRF